MDSMHILWFGHTQAWADLTKEDESLEEAIAEIEREGNDCE